VTRNCLGLVEEILCIQLDTHDVGVARNRPEGMILGCGAPMDRVMRAQIGEGAVVKILIGIGGRVGDDLVDIVRELMGHVGSPLHAIGKEPRRIASNQLSP
jgi:hypothetical protein